MFILIIQYSFVGQYLSKTFSQAMQHPLFHLTGGNRPELNSLHFCAVFTARLIYLGDKYVYLNKFYYVTIK